MQRLYREVRDIASLNHSSCMFREFVVYVSTWSASALNATATGEGNAVNSAWRSISFPGTGIAACFAWRS